MSFQQHAFLPFGFIICAPAISKKSMFCRKGGDQWRNLTEIQRTDCSTRWTRHEMLIFAGLRYAVPSCLHSCWSFLSEFPCLLLLCPKTTLQAAKAAGRSKQTKGLPRSARYPMGITGPVDSM